MDNSRYTPSHPVTPHHTPSHPVSTTQSAAAVTPQQHTKCNAPGGLSNATSRNTLQTSTAG
eukprot:364413-Chlamydomonas_euryale.AAC.3